MYCAGLTTTHAGEVYSTVCAAIIHYLQPTSQDYFSKSVGWEKGACCHYHSMYPHCVSVYDDTFI